jgi:spermidine synthase
MSVNFQADTSFHLWFEEQHEKVYGNKFKIDRSLFSGKSPFQRVDVLQSVGYGKILLCDGIVMLSERDEFIYHDMIVHPALFTHPNPESVLIIGGGDGGTLREALRHKGVKRCVMVEIDQMVVDACKEFIPQTACSFDDGRAELLIEDGVKFVTETDEKFDVVIVDSTDPIGAAAPLFDKSFYSNVHRILSDNGIAVAQFESPFWNGKFHTEILKIVKEVFPKRHLYTFTNMTYPSGLWTFSFFSKGLCPIGDFHPKRVATSDLDFQYYNSEIHKAAFALPSFMKKNLEGLVSAVEYP